MIIFLFTSYKYKNPAKISGAANTDKMYYLCQSSFPTKCLDYFFIDYFSKGNIESFIQ